MQLDMFDKPSDPADSPLAIRLRPRTLEEMLGQSHLLKEGSPLRRLVEGTTKHATSVILYGPPGTGKTTLAKMIALSGTRNFVEVSAVNAGVKEIREVIAQAQKDRTRNNRETVLFVDEVHRFSKTQQDALLPAVENGWVILVAATTENPSFSIISPLLSRSVVISLRLLTDRDIDTLIERALTERRGFNNAITLEPEARSALIRLAAGDGRQLLTYLESAAGVVGSDGVITMEVLTIAVDRPIGRYDRAGDNHYDIASAFIKSIRGSDVDASLHWLARMLVAGEDPRFIARRLMILASEDIGMADSNALIVASSAAVTVERIGMPEARITLAHATVYVALAPKSNAAYLAGEAAIANVQAGAGGSVPPHLRDAHSGGLRDEAVWQRREMAGYRYPHDEEHGVSTQQYFPDELVGTEYYHPTDLGNEVKVAVILENLRAKLRGLV
jgi:putative ATPase